MPQVDIERDRPVRVGADADADESRRLLSLIAMRIDSQARNAKALAETLGIQLVADPAEPIRSPAALATGLAKTDQGMRVAIGSLPEARMQEGWLIVQGESGEPKKVSIKKIVGGPYFPGSFMLNTMYLAYGPPMHGAISPMEGSAVAATRNDLWQLSGDGDAIGLAFYYLRDEGVRLLRQILRTGASQATS